MILLINGAFGVGKSTVARLLWQRIAGSRIYDPEPAGSLLMRLPSFLPLKGSGTGDFQDIKLWRRSVVLGTRAMRLLARDTVIVPMAFYNRNYFDEIVIGLSNFDPEIRAFCLKAPMPVIRERLERRGGNTIEWSVRMAEVCLEAHKDEHFGESIHTENRDPHQVAHDILGRLQTGR